MKNLATPSSILILISSSSRGELFSQPVRGNVRRIGRMLSEHVERSLLDPEYSFVAVRRILLFGEYSELCSQTNVRPIKNGLKGDALRSTPECLRRLPPSYSGVSSAERELPLPSTLECLRLCLRLCLSPSLSTFVSVSVFVYLRLCLSPSLSFALSLIHI